MPITKFTNLDFDQIKTSIKDYLRSNSDFNGFDFEGSGGLLNNIYADSENYKKSSDPATYHGNWARQTGIVIQKNPQKRYIRVVVNLDDYCPDNLQQLINLEHITIAEFKNRLQIL